MKITYQKDKKFDTKYGILIFKCKKYFFIKEFATGNYLKFNSNGNDYIGLI